MTLTIKYNLRFAIFSFQSQQILQLVSLN